MIGSTHTTADIHQEKVFETHIVNCLTQEQEYIERDCAEHYDVAHALDTELLFRFLKTTQPDAWQTLEDHYSAQADRALTLARATSFRRNGQRRRLRSQS
jgi:type I restriction enzyme, R subunit